MDAPRAALKVLVVALALAVNAGSPVARAAAPANLFPVNVAERYGYINRQGQIVIAPQFETVWDFSGGLAQAAMNRGGSGERLYIDKTGRLVWHE
jgi:hypothetical protein